MNTSGALDSTSSALSPMQVDDQLLGVDVGIQVKLHNWNNDS